MMNGIPILYRMTELIIMNGIQITGSVILIIVRVSTLDKDLFNLELNRTQQLAKTANN